MGPVQQLATHVLYTCVPNDIISSPALLEVPCRKSFHKTEARMSTKTATNMQSLLEQFDLVLRNGEDSSPETLRRMVNIAEASHEFVREQAERMQKNVERIERQERKLEDLDREKTLVRRQVQKYQLELADLKKTAQDYRLQIQDDKKQLANLVSANDEEFAELMRLSKETAAACSTLLKLQQSQNDVCRQIAKYQAIHDEWQAVCEAKESTTESKQAQEPMPQVVKGARPWTVPDCMDKVASMSSKASNDTQEVVPGSLEASISTRGAVMGCRDNTSSSDIDQVLETLLESLELPSSTEGAAEGSSAVTSTTVEIAVDRLAESGSAKCIGKQGLINTSSPETIAVECADSSATSEDVRTIAGSSNIMSLAAAADSYAANADGSDTENMADGTVHCMVQLTSSKHSKLRKASWSFKTLAAKAKTACKKLLVKGNNMNVFEGRRSNSSNGSSRRMSLFDWGSRIGSSRASLVQ